MTIGIDISVLNDPKKTGIAVYTHNLIEALLKIRSDDKFILFGIATFETYDYLKNFPFKNHPNVEMKIYKMPSKTFRTAFLLWQKLNWPPIESFVGKVDIFHSFNWYMPPQRSGKKVGTVFDLTALIYPELHHPRTSQLDKVRFQKLSKEADLIITISQTSKKDFLKFWPDTNIEVVYPGVPSIFTNKINISDTRRVLRKYNLRSGYFLSVATLEPRKNLEGLVEAYISSKVQRPLVVVGESGWKNEKLLDLLKKYKQSFFSNKNRIIVTGFIPDEDLVILYQQALCLVYPSFYEGFGLPVLEAISCGAPVICSGTSSLKEVGGGAVFYISPQNVSEIKRALIKIETNPTLRKELIKKGLKQAKKFSWEKSATRLNKLYHEFD